MSKDGFEQLLVRHCAPTLAGLKAASLVSLPRSSYARCEAWLKHYGRCRQDIKFLVLATLSQRVLVLIYRRELLCRSLRRPEARQLLTQHGYPADAALPELLAQLQERCQRSEGFPHEIGLFLDYPPADVQGFIAHQGHDFCYAGYWKIYANEAATRALFDRFTACTEALCHQLEHGVPMERLLVAV